MCPACVCKIVVVGEDADEHDRAGHGERHAKDQRGRPIPAECPRKKRAQARGDRTLRDGSGNRDMTHGEQFFDVELEADAEHQQNDTDLGQLLGQSGVGDEAGGVRPDQRARQQVTYNRGEPEALVSDSRGPAQRRGHR